MSVHWHISVSCTFKYLNSRVWTTQGRKLLCRCCVQSDSKTLLNTARCVKEEHYISRCAAKLHYVHFFPFPSWSIFFQLCSSLDWGWLLSWQPYALIFPCLKGRPPLTLRERGGKNNKNAEETPSGACRGNELSNGLFMTVVSSATNGAQSKQTRRSSRKEYFSVRIL